MYHLHRHHHKDEEKKVHYAWLICIAGVLMIFTAGGLAITGFGVYLPFLIDERGYSNTEISLFIFARTLAGVVTMLMINRLIKKFSLRSMAVLGLLFCAAAFVMFGAFESYYLFCLSGVVLGIGYGLAAMIPVTLLITAWFHSHSGLALGSCMAASGLSAFIGTPIITFAIEGFGLRNAFVTEAMFFALVAVAVGLIIRDTPEDKGVLPFGEKKQQKSSIDMFAKKTAPKKMILMMMVGWLFLGAAANNIHTNLSVLFQSVDFSIAEIATIVSAFGISLSVGKCTCGFLSDKLGVYKTAFILLGITFVGTALCCLASFISFPIACMGSIFVGFGVSTVTVANAPYAMEVATEKDYAKTVSRFQITQTTGGVIFSLMPGIVADLTGDYVLAYVILLACVAISIVFLQGSFARIKRWKKRQEALENKK